MARLLIEQSFRIAYPDNCYPQIMKTVAIAKIRSRANIKEESPLKHSPQVFGLLLLVKIMVFGPSLLYRRSMMSKNIRVFSLSNTQRPTSSIIRQEGLTSPLIVELSLPYLRASVSFWFNSVALRKYAFIPFRQHSRPYAMAR